jgi:hypothetical protein
MGEHLSRPRCAASARRSFDTQVRTASRDVDDSSLRVVRAFDADRRHCAPRDAMLANVSADERAFGEAMGRQALTETPVPPPDRLC